MVGFGLRTWLCIGWARLPTKLCLFHLDPGNEKWLRVVGPKSPHWIGSLECFSTWLVGIMNAPPGLGKGAPNGALGHEFVACGRELVRVVVWASLAGSEFASPGSTPVLSMGGLVFRHNSSSRRGNVLKKGRYISIRGLPSPDCGLEG